MSDDLRKSKSSLTNNIRENFEQELLENIQFTVQGFIFIFILYL